MPFHVYPLDVYDQCSRLENRPATYVDVDFWHSPLPRPVRWPALLDTGSPYTVLPGRVLPGALVLGGRVSIELLHCEDLLKPHERTIQLPLRSGAPLSIGGFGAPPRNYLPFNAVLTVPGFGRLDWEMVIFEDMPYAILGTSVLFSHHGICLRLDAYRTGRCWWRPGEFFRPPGPPCIPAH